MKNHKYLGKIEENWAGFSSDKNLVSSHFDNQEIEIFLGEEFDENGEEIDIIPTEKELDDYANTYSEFIKKH